MGHVNQELGSILHHLVQGLHGRCIALITEFFSKLLTYTTTQWKWLIMYVRYVQFL